VISPEGKGRLKRESVLKGLKNKGNRRKQRLFTLKESIKEKEGNRRRSSFTKEGLGDLYTPRKACRKKGKERGVLAGKVQNGERNAENKKKGFS